MIVANRLALPTVLPSPSTRLEASCAPLAVFSSLWRLGCFLFNVFQPLFFKTGGVAHLVERSTAKTARLVEYSTKKKC